MWLRLIENDVFDITQRVKEINQGYFLVYNLKAKRYEVYINAGNTPALCLTCGKSLDMRIIQRLYKTRVQNIKKITQEISAANEAAEQRAIDKALDKAGYLTREYLNFADGRK